MKVGSLFSGFGGLDAAVVDVLGSEVAWQCENDPDASAVLAHHWPDVPNLGDITAVDWSTVEPVDVLTGGFPCQDVSAAGRRAGLRPGTRSGLWSHMAYAIAQLRPRLVIVENVRGLLSAPAHSDLEPCPWCVGNGGGEPPLRALGAVLGDLAVLGFDAEWCGLRAADVGAPHGRFRVFIAATARDSDRGGCGAHGVSGMGSALGGWRSDTGDTPAAAHAGPRFAADAQGNGRHERRPESAGQFRRHDAALGGAASAADAAGAGRGLQQPQHSLDVDGIESVCGREAESGRRGGTAADSDDIGRQRTREALRGSAGSADNGASATDAQGEGLEGARPEPAGSGFERSGGADVDWAQFAPAIRRWERILGRPTPAPTVVGRRGARQLNPVFVEWLMGLDEGRVTAVPGLSRNAMLRILGNGVVPAQAAAALRYLLPMLAPMEAAA